MSKDVGMMDGAEQARVRMQPMTIRFSPEAYLSLRDMARRSGVSVAEIARQLTVGNLKKYNNSVRYLDGDDAQVIRVQLSEIGNALSKVGLELNRIGVNYNQEVRALNAAAKSSTAGKYASSLPTDELEKLLSEYRQVGKKVGELQCLIRG